MAAVLRHPWSESLTYDQHRIPTPPDDGWDDPNGGAITGLTMSEASELLDALVALLKTKPEPEPELESAEPQPGPQGISKRVARIREGNWNTFLKQDSSIRDSAPS